MPAESSIAALHLVRHGAVENPEHVVYAAEPGFGLSELGWHQAEAAAHHLAGLDVVMVVASPLQRAVETAAAIASPHHIAVSTDAGLREWELSERWAGRPWDTLPTEFPGELEAYLTDPTELPFSSESLGDLARRVAGAAEAAWNSRPRPGHVVLVAHQDPIEAGRRALCGRGLDDFHAAKPGHASVVTLIRHDDGWRDLGMWTPDIR